MTKAGAARRSGPTRISRTALRRLVSFRHGELVIAAAAFLGVLVLGILYGVLATIGVSVAELLVPRRPPARRDLGDRARDGRHVRHR